VAEGVKDLQTINKFPVDIQIGYKYDPEEFAGKEEGLRLSYFDETSQSWIMMPSYADPKTNYVIASSNHLTLIDVTSTTLQGYKIPDLSNFNTDLTSGAATYNYPIDVPTGPAGLKPSLTLTYNSQIVDSSSIKTQSSWVGMGFELETGSITRNTRGTDSVFDDTFALNLNGGSWLLMPYNKNTSPAYEDFYAENANFMRIRRYLIRGNPQGYDQDLGYWQVWDKSGNQFVFGYDNGLDDSSRAYYPYYYSHTNLSLETWEWALTYVKNIYGKQLSYSYDRVFASREDSACQSSPCLPASQVISIYLREIDYPNNVYRIWFDRE
jgi:hypothetical protein